MAKSEVTQVAEVGASIPVRRQKTPDQMREYKRLKALEYRKNAKKASQATASAVPAPVQVAQVASTLPPDIEAKIASIPERHYQLRFTGLFEKWQSNRASRGEVRELEQAGIIGRITVESVTDEILGGQRGIAEWIASESNITVTKMSISNWLRGTHLPKGCQENYPPAINGKYLKSHGRPWVERYLVDRNGVNVDTKYISSPGERLAGAEADIAEMKRDDLNRKMSRDWMMASAHEFTMASVGTVARNTVRDAMEKRLPAEMERALTELVADAELRASVLLRLRTVAAASTDEWQATFCRRLASLDEECQKNSQEEKEKR